LFKDEGMFHSISELAMRRSFTLLKSASKDMEMKEAEEEMRLLDYDEKYNQSVFDPKAIRRIEIQNLKIVDPKNKEI